MTEEIKEIIDKFKKIAEDYSPNILLDFEEEEIPCIQLKRLLNYITNLQKENENLKQQLDFIDEQNKHIDKLEKMIKDYKSRNEKAVEYIEKYLQEHVIDDLPDEESKFETEDGIPIPNAKEVLLNILEGGDE